MPKLALCSVSDRYIYYLQKFVDPHVMSNIGKNYVTSRKYLGIVLRIGIYQYYVPLSSPKNADYFINQLGQREIKKDTIPTIRLTKNDKNGNNVLLGTLKLSHMIPVPTNEIIPYDPKTEKDVKYKSLIEKEFRVINRNSNKILKFASIIYSQKTSGMSGGYLNITLDFKLLEKFHDNYSANIKVLTISFRNK